MKKISLLFLPIFFISFINAQDADGNEQSNENQTEEIDPIEKARQAKEAAEKAAAEADAANKAALEAAAAKAAKAAREKVKQQKEDEEARKAAERQAAEDAELDAVAKAAADEAKRKMAEELGLEIPDDPADTTELATDDSTQADEEVWTVEAKGPLSGFGLRLSGGMPIYGAKYLSSYSSVPSGSFLISTPYGFNAGPLLFTINLSCITTGYESSDDENKFPNFGAFLQLMSNTSELLNFIPTTTEIHSGIGFLPDGGFGFDVGGSLGLPIKLPIGIGLVTNATISQTGTGRITGWIYTGLEIGYNFK